MAGELRGQVDQIWNAFWTSGISNPLEVIEQITYLLFIRRLDDLQTLEESKAARLKRLMEKHIFPDGADPRRKPYEEAKCFDPLALKLQLCVLTAAPSFDGFKRRVLEIASALEAQAVQTAVPSIWAQLEFLQEV